MESYLYPLAPFNFSKMLKRPLSRPSKLLAVDGAAQSYTRAIHLSTRTVAFTAMATGTPEKPCLVVRLPDDLMVDERTESLEKIKFIFSVDVDLTPFIGQLYEDLPWQPLLRHSLGLRCIHDASLFESVLKAIIGQQITVQFAATLVERLVQAAGVSLEWNELRLPVFPTPEQVARMTCEQLRELSFSQRKAEYVIDFARAVVNQEVDLDSFWKLPDNEITASMTRLRGIGRWTVECMLLFGMGRPDVLPAADIGVQNAVRTLYGLDVRPSEADIRKLGNDWQPWRSYATYYLWNSLIDLRNKA